MAFAYLGYGVLSDREYFSNIRGRHSYIHSRVSSEGIPAALTYPSQLLAATDAETIFTHFEDVEKGGYIVYDSSTDRRKMDTIPSMEENLKKRLRKKFEERGLDGSVSSVIEYVSREFGVKVVALSYPDIISKAAETLKLTPSQASRYVSSIIVGAVTGLMNLDERALAYAIERRFKGRKELIEHNKLIIRLVYERVKEEYGSPLQLEESKLRHNEFMIVSGNDVVAMGKLAGGLRFQSYYPITPAADESFFLETFERMRVDGEELVSVVVAQTEDEIAAITAAIGASLTGTRSATATSGPDFSLMVEALGWAGMNETPVGITYYQRGGPSTGLPTRGSQSDLLFTLFASHGEFPRIVMASGDHLEAFQDAVEAFNFAEKYQTPVIHLLDKFLANSIITSPLPDFSGLRIKRGSIVEEKLKTIRDLTSPLPYRRALL